MQLEPFKLERFFAKYEFNVEYQMSASDCESMSVGELLSYDTNSTSLGGLEQLQLGYTESNGAPQLRKAVSSLYSQISPEGVLIAAPEELIFLFLNAHLAKDDHVVITTPAYQSLTEIPRSLGCRVSTWPVELQNGRWQLDFNYLEREISDSTKMVIVNIPHNPTGLAFTEAEKKDLTDILRRHGTLLLADEMYWQLEYADEVSSTPFCDLYEGAISLSGLSKAYGLPGLRIGWLAGQSRDLIEPAAQLKDYTTICNSAPSELLALIAVHNSVPLVGRCREIIAENKALLSKLAKRHPHSIELLPGQGGSILFPRFIDGRSAEKASQQLIEKQNLLMLPGPLFDMPDNYFRVGIGRTSFAQALSKFEDIL
ncbi:MAG: aminotransferase class I/II-fold pyridoxal phosphate-dependent enzyme [Spirochaetia bacterium]|nr:aminotransferase class I/II-fold pyridoxal phosphate-dependent enzyme [Spirochaetia bacterium]